MSDSDHEDRTENFLGFVPVYDQHRKQKKVSNWLNSKVSPVGPWNMPPQMQGFQPYQYPGYGFGFWQQPEALHGQAEETDGDFQSEMEDGEHVSEDEVAPKIVCQSNPQPKPSTALHG